MLSSLMTLAAQASMNVTLFAANQTVRQPGMIVGPIAKLLGVISNVCFNLVYAITPIASLGITIILFTIVIKLLLFPLSIKQQKSMIKTQQLQPKIKALQDKYKNSTDPESQQKMSLEMSALYKENKINPFSGCLPLLIQMPILFALWYVIQQPEAYIGQIAQVINDITTFITGNLDGFKTALIDIYQNLNTIPLDQALALKPILEAQQVYGVDVATISGATQAINAMSASDMNNFITTFFNQLPSSQNSVMVELSNLMTLKGEIYNFGFLNLVEAPGFKFPGIIVPLITWLTTYLSYKVSINIQQSKGQSDPNDMMQKQQKMMMMIFPFMMAFMTINLPSGLGLYWNVTNLIQIGQQVVLNKYFSVDHNKENDIIDSSDIKKSSKPKKKGV